MAETAIPELEVPGGGGDDGGDGGDVGVQLVVPAGGPSGDGGGGGGASSAASAAKAAQKRRLSYVAILRRLRLNLGPYAQTIQRAAQQEWPSDIFLYEVTRSKQFRRTFQGIGALFREGMTVEAAIGEWRRRAVAYKDVVNQLDSGVQLNKKRIGHLIRNRVSADELAQRLLVMENLQQTDAIRQQFNALLTQRQKKTLDERGWFRFLTGQLNDRSLYDLAEAAQLGVSGLAITPQEALGVARVIGAPGEYAGPDLGELVARARALKDVIGPELERMGVNDAYLVGLEGGADPAGVRGQVEQLVRQREVLAQPSVAPTRQRGRQGTPIFGTGLEEGF
jgi:hypothetical protein